MWSSFRTQVPGKWVLSGEHAVLSGATAIALPHPEFKLLLDFQATRDQELRIVPEDAREVIRELLLSLQDEQNLEGYSFLLPTGVLRLESTIPIGAGLGSSAALCVALTRWMAEPMRLSQDQWFEFAKRLEHRFHGKSSGMDIAVTSAKEPVSFSIARGAQTLGIRRIPAFTFHDTGLRARTSECVLRVERFREANPFLALKTDERMSAASCCALEGLSLYDRGEFQGGLNQIVKAMKEAQECFYSWELIPGAVQRLEKELLGKGALAVKLTGAGGGGFLVALWPAANSEKRS
jgi:mevalonate kinase